MKRIDDSRGLLIKEWYPMNFVVGRDGHIDWESVQKTEMEGCQGMELFLCEGRMVGRYMERKRYWLYEITM